MAAFSAISPAFLEAGADALVGGALRRLADRARDGDAIEHLLFGAELAQPSVVGRGQGLAGSHAGAGIADRELRRLIGLVVSLRTRNQAKDGHHALLGHAVAVLQ